MKKLMSEVLISIETDLNYVKEKIIKMTTEVSEKKTGFSTNDAFQLLELTCKRDIYHCAAKELKVIQGEKKMSIDDLVTWVTENLMRDIGYQNNATQSVEKYFKERAYKDVLYNIETAKRNNSKEK